MSKRIQEVKKLEDGTLAVKWSGSKKFVVVQDELIAQYVIYTMTRSSEEVFNNVNSRCK